MALGSVSGDVSLLVRYAGVSLEILLACRGWVLTLDRDSRDKGGC